MRNYKISESHSKEWLKVEITDEYGCETLCTKEIYSTRVSLL